ncbi:MAG: TIGR02147 family protein [Deltaproteobacteria bacterium]|nr:TIGR02147 family protein [Deltaproteobacteria bacterium]
MKQGGARTYAQTEIRKRLTAELVRLQERNSAYSLRSYARKLELSPSALSEILRGKRPLAVKTARRILERLCVAPHKSEKILASFASGRRSGAANEYRQLNMDYFHVVSDWYYFAILSLAETKDFRDDPSWIARRLGITPAQARTALERLERMEMLARGHDGILHPTGVQYATSSDIADLSIRKQHRQNLELAHRSLDRDAVDARDFSSMSMALDPALIPEAKNRIKKFRRELCAFLESGEKKEVYKMCIQLFPLTQTPIKENENESL